MEFTSDMTTHGIAPIPAENDPMYTYVHGIASQFFFFFLVLTKMTYVAENHLPLYQQQPGLGLLRVPCREP